MGRERELAFWACSRFFDLAALGVGVAVTFLWVVWGWFAALWEVCIRSRWASLLK